MASVIEKWYQRIPEFKRMQPLVRLHIGSSTMLLFSAQEIAAVAKLIQPLSVITVTGTELDCNGTGRRQFCLLLKSTPRTRRYRLCSCWVQRLIRSLGKGQLFFLAFFPIQTQYDALQTYTLCSFCLFYTMLLWNKR